MPIAIEGSGFDGLLSVGWIPTAWLLSAFLHPELLREDACWSPALSVQCLDQMLIRGDSTFPLFFLLALFRHFASELLALGTAEALEEFLSDLPWRIGSCQSSQSSQSSEPSEPSELAKLVESATILLRIAPISVIQSLRCVGAQCASGLLPDQLPGDASMWRRRYDAFVRHMLLPREWQLPLEGNEGRLEHAMLQWTGVYRVLSRDLPHLPCPSMSSIAGSLCFPSLPRRSRRLRLSSHRCARVRLVARPPFARSRLLLFGPPSRRGGPGRSPVRPGRGGTHVAVARAGRRRGELSPRAETHRMDDWERFSQSIVAVVVSGLPADHAADREFLQDCLP